MAQQAAILDKSGHHVELFVGFSRKYPLTNNQFGCADCTIHASQLWGPSVLGFFPRSLLALWKKARDFDFIHLNGAWNLTTAIASRIARRRGVPYIITMRGHFGAYHFRRLPMLKKIMFSLIEIPNIRHAFAMHATARWEVETSSTVLRHSRNTVIIPNPVDLADFRQPPTRHDARQLLGLQDSDFHIVHLGRLAKQKNIPFLIRAFAQAKLGKKAYLTLIGPPEARLKKTLFRMATQLDVQDQIRFIDFVSGTERCKWLAAADLFALPSFDENFCIVAVESVASGTHCLLSPHVGAAEFLPQDMLTVCELDLGKWVHALHELAASRKLQRIPQPGTFTQFSTGSVLQAWQQLYRSDR